MRSIFGSKKKCVPKFNDVYNSLKITQMEKKFVDVVYDRRKEVKTKGVGTLDVRVYIGRLFEVFRRIWIFPPIYRE